MHLVYLDPYHLGDPLFLTQLARDLSHRAGGAVLVHGSGEAGERALEATGALARQRDGVWEVQSPEEAAIVERATRELNRQIVHELNEVGVPAIRVMGGDRGLLKQEGEAIAVGSVQWIQDLVAQGVVGVLAALVDADTDALAEVDAVAAVGALATAIEGAQVVLLETGSSDARKARDAELVERLTQANVDATLVRRGDLRSISAG
ncbi:MAG: hypothetical protein Rubg2KO_19420 [Rubricoccaceae bacterium]